MTSWLEKRGPAEEVPPVEPPASRSEPELARADAVILVFLVVPVNRAESRTAAVPEGSARTYAVTIRKKPRQ